MPNRPASPTNQPLLESLYPLAQIVDVDELMGHFRRGREARVEGFGLGHAATGEPRASP